MKPAYVKWYGKQNGQERTATLRAGERGTGQVLATVKYWPNSGSSLDAAYTILAQKAQDSGHQIVATDRDEG